VVERGHARAYTRKGLDWSDSYPGVIKAASGRSCRSAILDGEVIVQDDRGVSNYEALKSAIRWKPESLIFYSFDLLHLDGEDLRNRPLLERRARLKDLIGEDRASPLQFSDEFTGDAAAFFRACAKHGLEGVVSKLASSRYRSGRSRTWLKTKCFTESSFVIIGTGRDRKTGAMLALLARAEEHGLSYAGSAFFGIPSDARENLQIRLAALSTGKAPLPGLTSKTAQWAQPKLTVRVRHLAAAKSLRHATVKAVT
jgi:ATP-dependent DNA ligase